MSGEKNDFLKMFSPSGIEKLTPLVLPILNYKLEYH